MIQLQQYLLVFSLVATAIALPRPVRAQSAPVDRTTRVHDIDMQYRTVGSGEPLVLIHPFGTCGAIWNAFADTLATRYQLIIIDQRGHGGSTNPGKVFTHRQSSRDVLALLDHLGISRFRAMGMSSGAMTLLHIAVQQPERIESMVLVSGTASFPPQARALLRTVTSADSLPPDVREQYSLCATRGMEQVRELVNQFRGFADSYDDMNLDAPVLRAIKARTLIVHGDRDEFFPVNDAVATYEAIPRAQLWVVPNGVHLPVFGMRSREFMDLSLDFLRAGTLQP